MNPIIHFEFSAEKPERAVEFYQKTFGWKFEKWEGGQFDYWMINTKPEGGEGIDGGMGLSKGSAFSGISNAIAVDSVDKTIEDIQKNGGTAVTPKIDLGGMGYMAYFKDTEGNVFSVYEYASKDISK